MKRLTLRTLDAKAAKLCKLRAGGLCERCGSRNAETSHFVGRTALLTRWDGRNLDHLCRVCHWHFTCNRRQYEEWRDRIKPRSSREIEALTDRRIPTTKALWMEQENARLDAALKEFE